VSDKRRRAIRALMHEQGLTYMQAMRSNDERIERTRRVERETEEPLSQATWIGLGVECKDPRWPHYFQPSRKIGAPHITLAYLGVITDEMYDIVVEKTYAWFNLGVFRTQRKCIDTVVVDRAALFGGHYTVFKVKEPAAYENGYLTNRDILTSSLSHNGVPVNTDYEFSPHVTVAYGAYIPIYKDRITGMKIKLTELFVSHRGEKKTFWYT
jgi:2'-5' RNA ligase